MKNKTCGECRHCKDSKSMGMCEKQKLCLCPEELPACSKFEPKQQTVFNRIMASPEVLAVEFVGMMYDRVSGEYRYYSMLTGEFYSSYEEAIAATVARLKEVEK